MVKTLIEESSHSSSSFHEAIVVGYQSRPRATPQSSYLSASSELFLSTQVCDRGDYVFCALEVSIDMMISESPPNLQSHAKHFNKMSSGPNLDDLHKALFEEGLKVRRAVVGDAYVDRALANGSTEFGRAGQELVTEFCWGYAWTRPGLERRDRSLINIGMLMALNRQPELAVHVRGARNNGLTELEIREAIIHATTYCGVPAGVDAFKTAEAVFNDMAEKGEKPRELGEKSARAE